MSADHPAIAVDAVDSHIAKWLAVEPEMEVALAFAGAGKRRAMLWGALLNEWLDATFDLSDAGVARVKLAWWGNALQTASIESPHPLVRALVEAWDDRVAVAPWVALTEATVELLEIDDSPRDVDALIAIRRSMAQALGEVERVLWPNSGAPDTMGLIRSLLLRQWRGHIPGRLPQPGWLPLQLLARHDLRMQAAYDGLGTDACRALLSDLATELLACPAGLTGSRIRRIRTQFDALALSRLQSARAQPFRIGGFRSVWGSWRAARGAPE
ncbi:hypothetical protein OS176_08265 [Xanthomonadaceae bacterium XH05]|nr:hypothetical protein [Xanthomonadaceae bacterium XH05]